MNEIKTGYEWCVEFNIRILEMYDWPFYNYSSQEQCYMENKITKEEFMVILEKCRVKPNSAPRKPIGFLEYRMYGLVPYNLSPIQQGIQYGHAVVEYGNLLFHSIDYDTWRLKNKTFIILNGGTTNTNPERLGTLNKHLQLLKENEIVVGEFYEPDLGDQLTAITFVVDERVFDKETYPNYVPTQIPMIKNGNVYVPVTSGYKYDGWLSQEVENKAHWVEKIGGAKNEFLRNFLNPFRLA